jgi:hypothetical protein
MNTKTSDLNIQYCYTVFSIQNILSFYLFFKPIKI